MSSTNKTLTIELSQYVGTDKPTYLTDYNGDMLKIDNAIAADRDSITTAQGKADGADAKADANATAIATLDGQVNNASNGLTKRVTDVEGDVNTIESLIGNGTPTTSDKTLIGAINELDTIKLDIADLTASAVPVSSISGLSATDVQAALSEIVGELPTASDASLGNYIDISAYNAYSNLYTVPSDGYIQVYSGSTDTAGARVYGNNTTQQSDPHFSHDAPTGNHGVSLFVKKGLKIHAVITGSASSSTGVRFFPIA